MLDFAIRLLESFQDFKVCCVNCMSSSIGREFLEKGHEFIYYALESSEGRYEFSY